MRALRILNDGRIITVANNGVINSTTNLNDNQNIGSPSAQANKVFERNNNLYFITSSRLFRYDFRNFTEILNINTLPVEASGINNNGFWVITNNLIGQFDFNGQIVNTINFDDIEFRDRRPINTGSLFFVSSNNDIVFYDRGAGAFRVIREI